ncbi:MAG: restriction endonuclease [Pseudomonadaceae bacterium]|nr:restriction endonuclease [Pseudomonadaceae bacterium]
MTMWMVRAGQGAGYIEEFEAHSVVAVGWADLGDISPGVAREAIIQQFHDSGFASGNRSKVAAGAGQLWRFLNEIAIGDGVVSYDPNARKYLVGEIKSEPTWSPDLMEALPRARRVEWQTSVSRDALSASARNSLGSISTLFMIRDDVADEIQALGAGISELPRQETLVESEPQPEDLFDDARARGLEFIKDRVTLMDGDEFEELVAGLLRAMGYKTRVSPKGPDRGQDIIASPDGLGLEQPRIIVECKHRTKTSMGAPDIRSFLGGRHPDDKGLYVSTGGFTREAKYEADRASINIALMDFDSLVEAIVENYENFDVEARALLPLGRVYWPI